MTEEPTYLSSYKAELSSRIANVGYKQLLRFYWGTLTHKLWVFWFMLRMCGKLLYRAVTHDWSKFTAKEAGPMAAVVDLLKTTKYNSPEYKAQLEAIQPSLTWHYKRNSHHPEHYTSMRQMSLLDVFEMLMDWAAAVKRQKNGDIRASIESNKARFGYTAEVAGLLHNTITEMFHNTYTLPAAEDGKGRNTIQPLQMTEANWSMEREATIRFFENNIYEVAVEISSTRGVHITVNRKDNTPIEGWYDLWNIKNDIVGEECYAWEIYPPISCLVDGQHQRHLFCATDPLHMFSLHEGAYVNVALPPDWEIKNLFTRGKPTGSSRGMAPR